MAKLKKDDMTNILINNVGVTNDSLQLALKLCGDTDKVYKDILFIFTGYSTFEDYVEEVAYEN